MLNLKHQKNTAFVLMGPLAIVAVFGAVSLSASFMVIVSSQARMAARDARIEAQMSQIRGLAEIEYNQATPHAYDGVCINATVVDLMADMDHQSKATSSCFASGDDYCISSPLASDPTKHACIGSNGVRGETVCTSAYTECK